MPDTYALDNSLLAERRLSTVALSALSAGAFFWLFAPSMPALPVISLLGSNTALYVITVLVSSVSLMQDEVARAQVALDSRAVKEYCDKSFPSEAAMKRIAARPRALAMLLDQQPPVDLNKRSENGKRLSEEIFFTPSWVHYNAEVGVQQMYIDACESPFTAGPGGAKSIFSLIESNPRAVDYLLRSKNGSPPEAPADQVNIWKQVKHPSNIEKLIKAGFDINAQDENGWTPLMHWGAEVQDEIGLKHDLIVKAISLGADPRIENHGEKKASDLAQPPHSVLSFLLKNTEEILSAEKPPHPEDTSLFRWLPWKPIACKGRDIYEIDRTREPRAWGVAMKIVEIWFFTTLTALVSALVSAPPALRAQVISHCAGLTQVMLVLAAAAALFGFIDSLRAGKEAKRQAVIEYIEQAIPSDQAMRTIGGDLEAAQMLIDAMQKISSDQGKKIFLNKPSSHGGTLLKFAENFEVFKLLLDHGADLLKTPPVPLAPDATPADAILGLRENGFLWAVGQPDQRFIEYIFQEDRDKGDLLDKIRASEAFQAVIWSRVQSNKMAQILIKQGFDPNVQDATGRTALMLAAHNLSLLSRDLDLADYSRSWIDVLLNAGANLDLKDNEGKTVQDYIGSEARREKFAEYLKFREERKAAEQKSS